jgi:hypothetical protein
MKRMFRHRNVPATAWVLAVAAVFGSRGGSGQRAVAQQQSSDDLGVVQLRPNFYMIAGSGTRNPCTERSLM